MTEGSSARSGRRELSRDFILFGGRAEGNHRIRLSGPCVRVAVCSWISSSGTALQDTPSRGTPMTAAIATAPEDAGPEFRPTAGTAPAPGTTNATNGVTNAACRSTTTE
jgi:hypothetical protein